MTAVPRIGQAVSFRDDSKDDSSAKGFAFFSRASKHALLAWSWHVRKAEFEVAKAPYFQSVANDFTNPVSFAVHFGSPQSKGAKTRKRALCSPLLGSGWSHARGGEILRDLVDERLDVAVARSPIPLAPLHQLRLR
jgi:hypothetical protein